MKKSLLWLFVILFLFTSCVALPPESNESTDSTDSTTETDENELRADPRYLTYETNGFTGRTDYVITNSYGRLLKVNTHTGKATHVCPDPLCSHAVKGGSACQFYLSSNSAPFIVTPDNMVIYFFSPFSIDGNVLKSYNLKTGELTRHKEFENSIKCILLKDKYLFVSEFYFEMQDEDEKNEENVNAASFSDIYRFDTTTEKLEAVKLNKEPLAGQVYVYSIPRKDRIKITGNNEWYTTDLNFEDRQPCFVTTIIRTDGPYDYRYSYKQEPVPGSLDEFARVCDIYKIDPQTNEEELILQNTTSFNFFSDVMIYTKLATEPVIPNYEKANQSNIPDFMGSEQVIYICDSDGKNQRVIYETEGDYFIPDRYSERIPHYGDYYLFSINEVFYHEKNKDYFMDYYRQSVLFNIKTGEYRYMTN